MNNEQALKLANACMDSLHELGGVGTPTRVFRHIEKNIALCTTLPVTLATVSRSLRSLLRQRRVFMGVVNLETWFSLTPILPEKKNTLRLSPEDQQRFSESIVNPPAPNDALRRAVRQTVIVHKQDANTARLEPVATEETLSVIPFDLGG